MTILQQIDNYINSLSESKKSDMKVLHQLVLEINPEAQLWFLDGKDSQNKVVSNPNIGYGTHTIKYADGKTKEFYQIGISANTTGISVYFFGIEDKKFLAETYGPTLGKATVTGYCIKFKTLQDIQLEVLKSAIQYTLSLKK